METVNGHRTPEGWRRELDTERHHRRRNWDYCGRGIYHVTMVVAEHFPLLGELTGATLEKASIQLNPYGRKVWEILQGVPQFYEPKGYAIKIIAAQMMPDHIHVVIQVLEPMPRAIGSVIRGFKTACTREYKEWIGREECGLKNEPEVHNNGPLVQFARIFARTESIWEKIPAHYHERVLHKEASLQAMIDYVKDNPRRRAIKRANPDLFEIHQATKIGADTYTTLGNMFLLKFPMREVLQCSRKLTQEEIDVKREECLVEADNGTVYVSAAVSEGEKQICKALREAGYPLIILLEKGFPTPDSPHYKYYKPSGVYFEACAKGKLLLIEPNEAAFEQKEIEDKVIAKAGDIPHTALRYRFLALNALAERIAGLSRDQATTIIPVSQDTEKRKKKQK